MARCSICPNSGPVIYPTGPTPCSILFIGAGGGKSEAFTERVYSGLAGQELDNTYLPVADMRRDEVRMVTAVQCWDGTSKTPSDDRARVCAMSHLPAELDKCKPDVVVLMGGAAVRLADNRLKLDMHRGIPQRSGLLGGVWEGWVVPMFDPGLGLRETSRMTQLLEDFRNLGKWVRGEWESPTPPVGQKKDYQLISTPQSVDKYMMSEFRAAVQIAIDTESHGANPWSIQFSHTPHTGRMILAKHTAALAQFAKHLADCETTGIMHFAGHDLDVLDQMGIKLSEFRDTMQESFHLCSLPQGLKPLAYRLLGVTMRSWEDVVWPASMAAVTRWMESALVLADENLTDITLTEMKRGKCVECGHQHSKGPCKREGCGCVSTQVTFQKVERKPAAVAGVLKHILTYTSKTAEDDEPYDPWKALARMRVDGLRGKKAEDWEWQFLDEMLGPNPILGIGNCVLEDAVEYGISDADHTGMVETELERLRGGDRWRIAEEDRDL